VKKLAPVFALAAFAATLALSPASAADSKTKTPASDPYKDGVTEIQIKLQACTKEDYTLLGDFTIEGSTSELAKQGGGDAAKAAQKVIDTFPGRDKLGTAWVKIATRPRNATPLDNAVDEQGEANAVLGAINNFAKDLSRATGVHFRMGNAGWQISDEGPGCSLRLK
jgi:hypothetical protein